MKKDIQDYYKKKRVNIQFPGAKTNGSLDEFIKNTFRLIDEGFAQRKNAKKPIECEPIQNSADQFLGKSFISFYRQLARSLHPDLEQNIDKRSVKEALIKKLTIIFKNSDLRELLILEMEWLCNQTAQTEASTAPADLLLRHEYFSITQVYGHGFNVVSKVKIKYGPLKARPKIFNKSQIKALPSL